MNLLKPRKIVYGIRMSLTEDEGDWLILDCESHERIYLAANLEEPVDIVGHEYVPINSNST